MVVSNLSILEDVLHPPREIMIVFMIFGVIFIKWDLTWGFQKYIILVLLSEKWFSEASPYLEDTLHPPKVPEGDHDD